MGCAGGGIEGREGGRMRRDSPGAGAGGTWQVLLGSPDAQVDPPP